jgi:hypothetical protein
MLYDDRGALVCVGLVHIRLHHTPVQPEDGLRAGHGVVLPHHCPLEAVHDALVSGATCTPEVKVRLPVNSFSLANSSLSVISYSPWAACPSSVFPSGKVTMPTSHLLSSPSPPAKYMLCEAVAPILPSNVRPLMMILPLFLACGTPEIGCI